MTDVDGGTYLLPSRNSSDSLSLEAVGEGDFEKKKSKRQSVANIGKGSVKIGKALGKGSVALGKGSVDVGLALGKGSVDVGLALGKGSVGVGKKLGKGSVGVGKALGKGSVDVGLALGKGSVGVGKKLGKGSVGVGKALGKGSVNIGKATFKGVMTPVKFTMKLGTGSGHNKKLMQEEIAGLPDFDTADEELFDSGNEEELPLESEEEAEKGPPITRVGRNREGRRPRSRSQSVNRHSRSRSGEKRGSSVKPRGSRRSSAADLCGTDSRNESNGPGLRRVQSTDSAMEERRRDGSKSRRALQEKERGRAEKERGRRAPSRSSSGFSSRAEENRGRGRGRSQSVARSARGRSSSMARQPSGKNLVRKLSNKNLAGLNAGKEDKGAIPRHSNSRSKTNANLSPRSSTNSNNRRKDVALMREDTDEIPRHSNSRSKTNMKFNPRISHNTSKASMKFDPRSSTNSNASESSFTDDANPKTPATPSKNKAMQRRNSLKNLTQLLTRAASGADLVGTSDGYSNLEGDEGIGSNADEVPVTPVGRFNGPETLTPVERSDAVRSSAKNPDILRTPVRSSLKKPDVVKTPVQTPVKTAYLAETPVKKSEVSENPSWGTESTLESSHWSVLDDADDTEEADEIEDSEGEDAPASVGIDPKLLAKAREMERSLALENEMKGVHKKSQRSSHSVSTFASTSSASQSHSSRRPEAVNANTVVPKSVLPPKQLSRSKSRSKTALNASSSGSPSVSGWSCLCGETNKAGFNFCGLCGGKRIHEAPSKWECNGCGRADNELRFKFCVGCGTQK